MMTSDEYKKHFRTMHREGHIPACRYCGLLSSGGCQHVVTDFVPKLASLPARLTGAPSQVAGQMPEARIVVRIGPNGVPLLSEDS